MVESATTITEIDLGLRDAPGLELVTCSGVTQVAQGSSRHLSPWSKHWAEPPHPPQPLTESGSQAGLSCLPAGPVILASARPGKRFPAHLGPCGHSASAPSGKHGPGLRSRGGGFFLLGPRCLLHSWAPPLSFDDPMDSHIPQWGKSPAAPPRRETRLPAFKFQPPHSLAV